MKKIGGIIALCLFIMYGTFAQNGAANTDANMLQQKLDALKGTYEVRAKNTAERAMPMLPQNLADIIEKNRKENEVNVVSLNNFAEVVIYPKNKVNKGSHTVHE